MGCAAGTSPGRLIETDADYKPGEGVLSVLPGTDNGLQFTPHGLEVDYEGGYIWTSDFVVPASVLKPFLGSIGCDRSPTLWRIPNGGVIHDVKLIPGNLENAAVATAVRLEQIWILYPKRIDSATGKPGSAELSFDLGPKARETVAIFSALTNSGKHMDVTMTTANHVAALDSSISDQNNVKRLDDPDEVHPIIGPYFLKIKADAKQVIVTDYLCRREILESSTPRPITLLDTSTFWTMEV